MSWQWTEATTGDLVRLWSQGLSAGQVATSLSAGAMPVSRSAVLGKLHRLGLLQRKAVSLARPMSDYFRINRNGRPRHRADYLCRPWRHLGPPPEPFTPSSIVVDSPTPLALLDMPPRGRCRWPLDVEPFAFCGNPCAARSYCSGHHALAYDAARTEEANRAAGLK